MRPSVRLPSLHTAFRRFWCGVTAAVAVTLLVTIAAAPPTRASAFDYSTISTGYHRTCAVTSSGRGLCWGWNHASSLGTGSSSNTVFVPSIVALPDGETFRSIQAGQYFMSCGLTTVGNVYCWGEGGGVARVELPANTVASELSVGASQGCVITSASQLYCWGDWLSGELGVGDIEPTNLPVRVTLPNDATPINVSAGIGFTCAVSSAGNAYCWGVNGDGQLGNGNTVASKVPVRVVSSPGIAFARISAGLERTCAIDTSGGGWCWGRNYNGALGDGTYTNSTTPRRVAAPSDVTFSSLQTGWYHTCAITTLGSVLCWGENGSGALGTGATFGGKTIRAAALPAGVGADSLSVGLAGTCITTTNRHAYCWGGNLRGSVGVGNVEPVPTPTRILGVGAPDVPSISLSSVTTHGATVSGSIIQNGAPASTDLVVADNSSFDGARAIRVSAPRTTDIAGLFTPSPVISSVAALRPATEYFAKFVVTTPYGRGESDPISFTTLGARPAITRVAIVDPQGDNVKVTATVAANLLDTSVTITIADNADLSRNTRTFTLGSVPAESSPTELTSDVSGLSPRTTYWANVTASNEVGSSSSNVVSFTTSGDAPRLTDLRAKGTKRGGAIHLSVNAGGLDTNVDVSYRKSGSAEPWSTARQATRGTSSSHLDFDVSNLEPATKYDVKAGAGNALGTVELPVTTFSTLGGAPVVDTPTTDLLADTSVTLIGVVDANEFASRVTLQIDTSEDFANPDEWFAGTANVDQATTIALDVSQLSDSTTYHARFVATNSHGTTVGAAVSFTTSTPVGKLLKRRTNPTDPAPVVTPVPVIDLPVDLAVAPSPATRQVETVARPARVTASAIKSPQTKQKNQARPGFRTPRLRPQSPRRR